MLKYAHIQSWAGSRERQLFSACVACRVQFLLWSFWLIQSAELLVFRCMSCSAKYSISDLRFSARLHWNWIIGFVFSHKIVTGPKPDANSLIKAQRLCGNVDRSPDSRAPTYRRVKAVWWPPLLSYLNYCVLSSRKTERMCKFGDLKLVLSVKTAARKYVSF
jgi:hypothetical protein